MKFEVGAVVPSIRVEDALLWGSIYGGVVLAVGWLAMVIWVYRDMRARSRDTWMQILVSGMVLALSFPGLLIYLFLRPRETLTEAYERSLEEEALLQEIEEKPTCPGCGHRTEHGWQACPHCHTRLKKPCIHCGQMLQLSWEICPYCAALQTTGASNTRSHVARSVRANPAPATLPEQDQWSEDYEYGASRSSSSELEFVDEDY